MLLERSPGGRVWLLEDDRLLSLRKSSSVSGVQGWGVNRVSGFVSPWKPASRTSVREDHGCVVCLSSSVLPHPAPAAELLATRLSSSCVPFLSPQRTRPRAWSQRPESSAAPRLLRARWGIRLCTRRCRAPRSPQSECPFSIFFLFSLMCELHLNVTTYPTGR